MSGVEGRKDVWGRIAYERLPTFCYYCGRLGHIDVDCNEGFGETDNNQKLNQYGDWLRASPLKKGLVSSKKQSSKSKTNAFLEEMRTKGISPSGEATASETATGGVARRLNLGGNFILDSVPKPQKAGVRQAETHDIDQTGRE
ncbi:hypothetical protein DITRI_Ditri02bG0156100 [Diplodiscus trichospermus]